MIQKERYIGLGIDQDTAPDKRKTDKYWDAENIHIVNNGRSLSIKPLHDKELLVSFDTLAPNLHYLGSVEILNILFVFLTDNTGTPNTSSNDYLVAINLAGQKTTVVSGKLGFSTQYPIESIANYENENLIKIYFVDGYNQLRVINVARNFSNISTFSHITATPQDLDVVKEVSYVRPEVTIQEGGSLVAGTVQYAYSLYNVNGSETKISPLSGLESVALNGKGGESGQIMNISAVVDISNVDTKFEQVRLFRIHYQELNQTPSITLIADEAISSSNYQFIDDGNAFIAEYSIEQFLFLGSEPIYPYTLQNKENRLFLANYKSTGFEIPKDQIYDSRVFCFTGPGPNGPEIRVKTKEGTVDVYLLPSQVPLEHDAINEDPKLWYFQSNGTTPGAEGVNFKVSFLLGGHTPKDGRKFKLRETYRIGVVYFNRYGQRSPAYWMFDFYNQPTSTYGEFAPHISLTSTGVTHLESVGVVGYQIVAVERKEWDRTIVAQGFIVPSVSYETLSGTDVSEIYYPHYIVQTVQKTSTSLSGNIAKSYEPGVDWHAVTDVEDYPNHVKPEAGNSTVFFYSPEVLDNPMLTTTTKIRISNVALSTNNNTAYKNSYRARYYKDNLPTNLGSDSDTYTTRWTTLNTGTPRYIMDTMGVNLDSSIYKYEFVSNLEFANTYPSVDIVEVDVSDMKNLKESESLYIVDRQISNYCYLPKVTTNGVALDHDLNSGLITKYTDCIAIKFPSTSWHMPSGSTHPYSHFIDSDNIAHGKRYLPIIELIRDLPNQYGGNSYEAKQRNEYAVLGEYVPIGTTEVLANVGDIYKSAFQGSGWPFRMNRSNGGNDNTDRQWDFYEMVTIYGLETTINLGSRNDEANHWDNVNTGIEYRFFTLENNFKLLTAYNQKSSVQKYYAIASTYNRAEQFPNRIIASPAKYPGEMIDNWTQVLPNEYMDLDGRYGAIQRLYSFKDEVIAFQDEAVAQVAILPRVQATGNDGVGIYLGTGQLLHDYTYITTISGTTEKFSIVDDNRVLMYYNNILNTLTLIDGTDISVSLGVQRILDDNPRQIHQAVYDRKNNEFLFLFNSFTLVYNNNLRTFTSRNDSHIKLMKLDDSVIDIDIPDTVTKFNLLYASSSILPSKITYLMNPNPIYEKVYHNLEYRLYGQDFSQIEVSNDRSTSGVVPVDVKNKFDIHRIHLPRVQDSRERWRGIYIFVKLSNNGNDYSLDDMVVMYNLKG